MQMMHCGQLIPNINVLVADGSLTVYILHTPLTVLDVLTIDHVTTQLDKSVLYALG